jgi:hypothetical protein
LLEFIVNKNNIYQIRFLATRFYRMMKYDL